MYRKNIVDMVESQVIAAIKDDKLIDRAIESHANIAFLLTGNLFDAERNIKKLKENNMDVFVHMDFIEGIDNSKSAVKFIAEKWKPDGIITTKNHMVKFAKNEGLIAIQRVFLIDKGGVERGIEMTNHSGVDAVEVLPGVMPRVIDDITRRVSAPIIAGGLIVNKEEIMNALEAGALATSVSDPELWDLKI